MIQYDVQSAHAETSGVVVNGRNRLKGFIVSPGETPGDIIFRDGSVTGNILLQVNITANVTVFSTTIPGDGILFKSGVYVALPVDTKVTVFYG